MHASTNFDFGRWLIVATVAGAHALLLAALAHLGTSPTPKPLPIEVALLRADRPEMVPPEPLLATHTAPPSSIPLNTPPAADPKPTVSEAPATAPSKAPAIAPPTAPAATPVTAPPAPLPAPAHPPRTAPALSPPQAPRVQPASAPQPGADHPPMPRKDSSPPTAQATQAAPAPAANPSPAAPAPHNPPGIVSAEATPPATMDSSAATAPAPNTPSQPAATGPRADASWSGNTPPPYPPAARRLREEGDVRLSVHIDEAGRVTEVKIARSSGSPRLDAAAVETVKKWRFKPATVDGQAVASWYDDWLWSFRVDP